MADLASDTSPDRLSLGVAAGALSLAVVLAVAVGAWTWGCDAGLPWNGMCGADTATVVTAPVATATAPETAAPQANAGQSAARTPARAPLQLVAATFETLDAAAAPAAKKSTTTRVVKTIQVRPQDAPGTASAAVAGMGSGGVGRAANATVPLAPTVALSYVPAVVAAAGGSKAQASADETVEPLPAASRRDVADKPATTSGHQQIVGGKGVTVRASPKSGSKALFTLAAGKKVTVSDKEHGWLHITDPDGRDGWAYSGLFRKAG